eukprot:CAMPEP_0119065826 /NCGR_PEP_ID=MMETSP1178-20130426/8547_1 /TAXON_ID=33656 /ORGANISM="unid sp, Strain CCMP2000" /LENGTH=129 /DNA_ID=CAMNT_0007047379 /DNA_START=55 /DNA_END=444 /DNA_ORIENTATION=+
MTSLRAGGADHRMPRALRRFALRRPRRRLVAQRHQRLAEHVLARGDAPRRLHPQPRVHIDAHDHPLAGLAERGEQRRATLRAILRAQRRGQQRLALVEARLGDCVAPPAILERGKTLPTERERRTFVAH